MTAILISALVFVSILFIVYATKYSKVKNKITEYNNLIKKVKDGIESFNSPLRQGYYKMQCNQNNGSIKYESIVYVTETDRYKNGDSKIKFKEVEIECGNGQLDYDSARNFARRSFISLVKTSDITWLESEVAVKQIRKDKLKHLTDVITGIESEETK